MGKSPVLFIATKILRENGTGPTLIIGPPLTLMENQIEAAERVGVRAVTANDRVIADIEIKMGNNLEIVRGDLIRENLAIQVNPLQTRGQRLAWLVQALVDGGILSNGQGRSCGRALIASSRFRVSGTLAWFPALQGALRLLLGFLALRLSGKLKRRLSRRPC